MPRGPRGNMPHFKFVAAVQVEQNLVSESWTFEGQVTITTDLDNFFIEY